MGLIAWAKGVGALIRRPKGEVPEVSAAEARRLQEGGAVVIDVRERGEWNRGHVAGAVHIPLAEIADRAEEIPRDKPVVLHCALGSRSRLAARHLAGLGFGNVHNLKGGIRAWKEADLPTEK